MDQDLKTQLLLLLFILLPSPLAVTLACPRDSSTPHEKCSLAPWLKPGPRAPMGGKAQEQR